QTQLFAKKISLTDAVLDYQSNNDLLFVPIPNSNCVYSFPVSRFGEISKENQILYHGQTGVVSGTCYRHKKDHLLSLGSDGNIFLYEPENYMRFSNSQIE
ncbi:hypothetical protein BB560_004278, partial [Smittium megazygosporum]